MPFRGGADFARFFPRRKKICIEVDVVRKKTEKLKVYVSGTPESYVTFIFNETEKAIGHKDAAETS